MVYTKIVVGIRIVGRETNVRHGFAESDATPEATLTFEFDDLRAISPMIVVVVGARAV